MFKADVSLFRKISAFFYIARRWNSRQRESFKRMCYRHCKQTKVVTWSMLQDWRLKPFFLLEESCVFVQKGTGLALVVILNGIVSTSVNQGRITV